MSACWSVPIGSLNLIFLIKVSAGLLFFLLQLLVYDYVSILFLTKLSPF